jgi:hypothetical protein
MIACIFLKESVFRKVVFVKPIKKNSNGVYCSLLDCRALFLMCYETFILHINNSVYGLENIPCILCVNTLEERNFQTLVKVSYMDLQEIVQRFSR